MAEYRTESLPEAWVIEVRGEIDISNVAELTRRVREALADGASSLLLDLYNVTHLDSSGLSALIAANQHVGQARGGKLALVLDPVRLRRTFQLRAAVDSHCSAASRREHSSRPSRVAKVPRG